MTDKEKEIDNLQELEAADEITEETAELLANSAAWNLHQAELNDLKAKELRARAAELRSKAKLARADGLKHEAFSVKLFALANEVTATAHRLEADQDTVIAEVIRRRLSIPDI